MIQYLVGKQHVATPDADLILRLYRKLTAEGQRQFRQDAKMRNALVKEALQHHHRNLAEYISVMQAVSMKTARASVKKMKAGERAEVRAMLALIRKGEVT